MLLVAYGPLHECPDVIKLQRHISTRNRMPPQRRKSSKAAFKTDSHLYTDDNPESTLHGTGFSSAETAERTIKLVSKRSRLYQFQVINTMYNRAKHVGYTRQEANSDV